MMFVSFLFANFALADRIEAPVWGKRAVSRHNKESVYLR